MTEIRLRVNENGRVVLPVAFRRALDIRPGDQVLARLEGDEVRITTLRHRLERAQRHVRQYVKPGVSLADELIAERREAARRE
ncbi:MAG TPA: AbrB/MazE/SpoVT family DNA-binding domain-containing protein [Terriglobia bacterium]|nr:AbrB/MazE/SpoVT family DNA-binding domain-containing protein [Terriglobia bacterium]